MFECIFSQLSLASSTPTIPFLRPHALPLSLLLGELVRQPKSSKIKKTSKSFHSFSTGTLTKKMGAGEGGRARRGQFQNKSLRNGFHSPDTPQTGSRKSIQHTRDQRTDFTMKDFFFGFVLFLTYLKFQKRKKKVGQRGGRLFFFFWRREAIGSC